MAKADQVEIARRVEMVRILLISGVPSSRIAQNRAEEWGVNERQLWKYIARARKEIEALSQEEKEYTKAEHLAFRRLLRQRSLDSKDLRMALDAAKDEAKLLGLYAPDELNVNWREQAEREGVDASSIFERMVQAAVAAMDEAGNSGSVGGSSTADREV